MTKSLRIVGVIAAGIATFGIGLFLISEIRKPPADRLIFPAASEENPSETVKLTWKFKQGDTFYVENRTTTKQLPAGGQAEGMVEKTTTAVTRYRVLKTGSEGTVLQVNFEGTKVAGDDALTQALARISEETKGIDLRATISPTGQLTRLDGFDEYIKQIAGDNEGARAGSRAFGLEETIKEGINLSFGFLPEKEVTKGASWRRPVHLRLGPLGGMEGETEYTYRGAGKEGREISFTGSLNYELPKEAGGPFKATGGNVKTEQFQGSLVFDDVSGRLIRLERRMHFKGSVTAEAFGKALTKNLDQESQVTIRVLAQNPLKE